MSHFEQPSFPRAVAQPPQSDARPAASGARVGDAVSFLFTYGNDPRRESRRITLGFVGLVVLGVVLVNFGVYQSAQQQLMQRGWQQLAASTDVKRDQIRSQLAHFQRQTRYMAEEPELETRARVALTGRLAPAEQARLRVELERAVGTFKLHRLVLATPEGRVLAEALGEGQVTRPVSAELVRRAAQARETEIGGLRHEPNGDRTLDIAAPMTGAEVDDRVPVLIAGASADEALSPVLTGALSVGSGGRAYLVRQEGSDVLFLSEPGIAPQVTRAPLTRKDVRAAAMAAAGIESNVEVVDSGGRTLWSATRFLPEVDWGLVGEIDRSIVLAGIRVTMVKLLLLDLAIILVVAAIGWLWRRQYQRGLARHEVEVTRRHAARVQAILDTAFDAIITFDREGRVRTLNNAAESMFGRTAAEMDGQPLHRFLHWGGDGARGGMELPRTGVVIQAEAMRADGSVFPIEFSLGRAGEGAELLYTAIVRDISERVDAEQRIRSFAEGLEISNRRLEELNAQLEEASRLKSEFLANTSHELRTPLNGMIGFLQLVLDDMCENEEEERDFLGQALQCSRNLLALINDVLDIAKIEAGKLALEIDKVDVRTLFDEVHAITRVQAAQKGIALRFDVVGDTGHSVRCDFAKTKQVLINLVGNSLKFTAKGSITVRATAHPDLGHFMFEVLDTGVGIPTDRQDIIFEKFTQADGSTTRKYGGTGLGLAISRSLVELMGGIIGVQSDGEGRGTRMYFSLPVWSEVPEAPVAFEDETSVSPEGPESGPLVLIVEDNPTFRQFLRAHLHARGYRTIQANHAQGGWTLARRFLPRIVILDYALTCPDGADLRTGWDLAQRMTSDEATRHIPLIFVTGFDQELREKLKSTAFARKPEHVVKPIDGNELVAKIEAMLPAGMDGRGVRVLMADDDPAVASFVRKVLPEGRFDLTVTTNGEECLHALRTQPRGFDLLLLDLMMPSVSGYDVLREMTLSGTGAELPVLVLTNFPEARDEEERRLLEHGLVLDVLPKASVHDNPMLLAHILEWHLQAAGERSDEEAA